MAAVDESWGSVIQMVISDVIDKNLVALISSMQNDEERIRACISNSLIARRISSWIDRFSNDGRKSLEKSDLARLEGNKHFQNKMYSSASQSYSKAIRYCPTDPQTDGDSKLAIAYANRSAALFYLSKHELCLRDIGLAVSCGYPSHLLYKVYVRKANCLSMLSKVSDSKHAAEIALKLIEGDEILAEKRKESLRKELSVLLQHSKIEAETNNQQNSSENPDVIPDVSYERHEKFSSASSALDIRYSEDKGRYIVANRTVSYGDVLFVEKPFASVLLPEFYHSHCHHCHALTDAPLPCGFCCDATYCDLACASEAYDSYHRVECGFLKLLHASGLGHLAIRIILKAGIAYLLKNKNKLQELENDFSISATPFQHNGRDGDDYFAVYSLIHHSNGVKPDDRFAYILSAAMLLKLLNEELEKCGANDDQTYFIGCLLLRHIHQLICNAFTITKLDRTESFDIVETESQVRIASAIYPVASLMNHSCDPTIISSFHKDVLIVRAVKNVTKNDEIFNCYGPHYLKMSKAERQTCLKQQYFFRCKCDKCSTEDDVESRFNVFCCLSCSGMISNGVCRDCKRQDHCEKQNLDYSRSKCLYQKATDFFNSQDFVSASELLRKCLKLQRVALFRYNNNLGRTFDFAAHCAAKLGNYDEAIELLKSSLEIVEKTFGSDSIELANESRKLIDIQVRKVLIFNSDDSSTEEFHALGRTIVDALENVNRALDIFQCHYGAIHQSTKEMSEKQHLLKEIYSTIQLSNA